MYLTLHVHEAADCAEAGDARKPRHRSDAHIEKGKSSRAHGWECAAEIVFQRGRNLQVHTQHEWIEDTIVLKAMHKEAGRRYANRHPF